MENNEYKKTVTRVGITTIIWNLILSLAKLIGGFLVKSNSLVSDGVHSASDVLSTIVVIIGAKISKKKADEDHPFGHERMESVASIILAVLLAITAIGLGYSGIISIKEYVNGTKVSSDGNLIYVALSFAIASIIIKAWMYFYTLKNAKKINSSGLKADAFHHLTDSLSSIASLLGIIGMMIGGYFAIADPIASIVISLFIIKVAFDIAKDAFNQVVDKAAPKDFQDSIYKIANSTKGVIKVNSVKTRMFGNMYYVELEIAVDDNITVKEGHNIAKLVHDSVEKSNKDIKHCMIHIDPISAEKDD